MTARDHKNLKMASSRRDLLVATAACSIRDHSAKNPDTAGFTEVGKEFGRFDMERDL